MPSVRASAKLEDDDATLGRLFLALASRAVHIVGQLQARLLEFLLSTLLLLPSPDLVDDEGGKHGRSLAFKTLGSRSQ